MPRLVHEIVRTNAIVLAPYGSFNEPYANDSWSACALDRPVTGATAVVADLDSPNPVPRSCEKRFSTSSGDSGLQLDIGRFLQSGHGSQ
jgi:hypothetical protein